MLDHICPLISPDVSRNKYDVEIELTKPNLQPVLLQVILQHFFLRRSDILAQCEHWKSVLSGGIKTYPARASELTDKLKNLTAQIELLRTELTKSSL